ncbi:MAG: LysE family transporter [Chitinophagaceae bacterium]
MLLLIGVLISFLGQLPIGYINVIAVKIAVDKSVSQALRFAFGIAIVEVLYLAIIIYSLSSYLSNPQLFKTLQVITATAFIAIAIFIVVKWLKSKESSKPILKKSTKNSFVLGLIVSATNLAQFPFWIIWISYLINLKLFINNTLDNQLFIIGTGFGTLLGIMLYIFAGKFLLEKYKKITNYLDLVIAFFLLVAAGFQVFEML